MKLIDMLTVAAKRLGTTLRDLQANLVTTALGLTALGILISIALSMLKLVGLIQVGWLWVFSPVWGPLLLLTALLIELWLPALIAVATLLTLTSLLTDWPISLGE